MYHNQFLVVLVLILGRSPDLRIHTFGTFPYSLGEYSADAAEYIPGIKAAYGDWINDINEKTAEVMTMIQMYK